MIWRESQVLDFLIIFKKISTIQKNLKCIKYKPQNIQGDFFHPKKKSYKKSLRGENIWQF